MCEHIVGDLVISLCGHDRGSYLIVTEVNGDFVTVCDGKRRKNAGKKQKRKKHVQATGLHSDLINNTLPQYAVDSNIRREIKRLRGLI